MEIDAATQNPFFGAIYSRSMPVVRYLPDAGIDSAVRHDGYPGPYMDARAFAQARGERDIARVIADHRAKGDTGRVDELPSEAERVADLNNQRVPE